MTLIKRNAKKGAKAYLTAKGAKKAARGAKKTAKGAAVYKTAKKAAPWRLVAALGGIAAAAGLATFAKKRHGDAEAEAAEPAATAHDDGSAPEGPSPEAVIAAKEHLET